MFSEVELVRDVAIIPGKLDKIMLERSIITRLLEDLSIEKASKEHGYFLSITSLKDIGKQKLLGDNNSPGEVCFPVSFNCRTFLPVKGETLQGVVYRVLTLGVLLKCGPVYIAFLSARKMPNYRYIHCHDPFVDRHNPFFVNDDLAKIEVGVVVQFLVLDVRCTENADESREFELLASIDGDSLGPLSLTWRDEPEV